MNWEQFFLIGRRDRVGDSFKTLVDRKIRVVLESRRRCSKRHFSTSLKENGDGTDGTFSNRRGSVQHCDRGVRAIPRRNRDGRGQDARFLEDERAARHVLALGSGLAH